MENLDFRVPFFGFLVLLMAVILKKKEVWAQWYKIWDDKQEDSQTANIGGPKEEGDS